jgi:hypothetical protein
MRNKLIILKNKVIKRWKIITKEHREFMDKFTNEETEMLLDLRN